MCSKLTPIITLYMCRNVAKCVQEQYRTSLILIFETMKNVAEYHNESVSQDNNININMNNSLSFYF